MQNQDSAVTVFEENQIVKLPWRLVHLSFKSVRAFLLKKELEGHNKRVCRILKPNTCHPLSTPGGNHLDLTAVLWKKWYKPVPNLAQFPSWDTHRSHPTPLTYILIFKKKRVRLFRISNIWLLFVHQITLISPRIEIIKISFFDTYEQAWVGWRTYNLISIS